jgi:predicted transcriptional regulator
MGKKGKRPARPESVRKWSLPVMEAGFTILPSVLMTEQHELGLDPIDLNILLQLATHWWTANRPPYLTKATLARRLGVHPSTIRRHVARLEERGLLKRVKRTDRAHRQRSNLYDLKPLVAVLHPHAVKAIKERAQRREARRQT